MKIGFIGAGKMAEGILQGMLASGVECADVAMAERNVNRALEMSRKYKVEVLGSPELLVKKANVIFLSVRPQDVADVADQLRGRLGSGKLLVSIVAGKTIASLRNLFGGEVRIVRVMPNLALRVGEGMCAVCGAVNARPADLKKVKNCLSGAGEVVELAERHFDAVTALSGSGPAFYAYFEQAMIAGGVKLGLPADVARLLAKQTMLGTAKYVKTARVDLSEFIAGVATKGGTTAAGMDVLAKSGIDKKVAATLKAAARRSKELS